VTFEILLVMALDSFLGSFSSQSSPIHLTCSRSDQALLVGFPSRGLRLDLSTNLRFLRIASDSPLTRYLPQISRFTRPDLAIRLCLMTFRRQFDPSPFDHLTIL
jgi:hypothetical protein